MGEESGCKNAEIVKKQIEINEKEMEKIETL